MIQSKLRNRFGLAKEGKLVFCYRMLRGKDEILTSCFGLMTDSAVVDSALVDAALRKSGLISNGCSGLIIYLCGQRQIRPYIKWKRIIKKLKVLYKFKILFKYSWI